MNNGHAHLQRPIVLAAGVFDLLHPGHVYFLREARALGSSLVVVITSDDTARRQGKTPVFSDADRRELVGALRFVDTALVGEAGKDFGTTLDVMPDVIALGYDQFSDIDRLRKDLAGLGWQGRIERVGKFGDYSSSSLLKTRGV
ncbi:MAG TPA: adenylyltransferase/cytidyltransferase family protein [Dehalococcoidia bacterium]|jgi:cytidyltransferase-like protein